MSETIDKLDEAGFFLNKLKEHKNIFPEFDYFLNAFVSSSRSVLWIMNSEYASNEAWIKWYNNKSPSESEIVLIKGTAKMRNRSLKQAPLKTKEYPILNLGSEIADIYDEMNKFVDKNGNHKKYKFVIEEVDNIENRKIIINDNELSMNGMLNIYYTEEEFKDSNIVDKCDEYFLWLKSIVEECTSLFSNKDN